MSELPHRHLHEANRLSWNAATSAHNSHKGDQASYFRGGGSKLYPDERELLGDVRGLDIVHLQCNCGQDTLSLANLGARHVTGVDISDDAITFAGKLAADAGITNARFIRSDVYDWLAGSSRDATEAFDIAFSSYGAICWLSDLPRWARGVAHILKPGGKLVLVDYHPVTNLFDEHLQSNNAYFIHGELISFSDGISDYVASTGGPLPYGEFQAGIENFQNPHPSHEFQWGIGSIISAVLDAGLQLTSFRELEYANGFAPFKNMRNLGDRRFAMPPGAPNLPLMYALAARKPA